MPARHLVIPLLLSGCYPYISGDWEDYAAGGGAPNAVQILGQASQSTYVGGYWSGGGTEAELWWGWYPEADSNSEAIDILSFARVGCGQETDPQWIYELFGDPGASSAVVAGFGGSWTLMWKGSQKIFHTTANELGWGTYSLAPLETVAAGTIEVEDFISVPAMVTVTGPEMRGGEVATVTTSDFEFNWSGAAADADYIGVNIWLINQVGNDWQWLENRICIVEASQGSISFEPGQWTMRGQADSALISIYTINESHQPIKGLSTSSRMLGVTEEIGFVYM